MMMVMIIGVINGMYSDVFVFLFTSYHDCSIYIYMKVYDDIIATVGSQQDYY